MPLIKVEYGLLEEENFYLTSPAANFLGDGLWSRTNDAFTLKSGCIKRRLPYRDFVIDVYKNPSEGKYEFFIETDGNMLGIEEVSNGDEVIGWRIIYYDGFIQTYCTSDNILWTNSGGGRVALGDEVLQGFRVVEGEELVLTKYEVSSSPYVTIQNFAPGTLAKLYNSDGAVVIERLFDENHECKLFLSNAETGYTEISDGETILFTSPTMEFKQGDVFLYTLENIQLIYKDNVLNYRTTALDSYIESLTVRNAGNENVSNIIIEVLNQNNDLIELSFDNVSYSPLLNIEALAVGGEIDFYMKVTKAEGSRGFDVNNFDIQIYEGVGGSL